MSELANKVVVITGATGGLGQDLAVALRAKGAKLALLGRKKAVLEDQVAELGSEFAHYWVADVTSSKQLQAAFAGANSHFGRIDVVVANAGVLFQKPLEVATEDEFANLIDVNLVGVYRTFHTAIPYVKETKGYLAAVASMSAFVHCPLFTAYGASKAGVAALCDSLRLELRQFGVGVGTYFPTFFHSPMFDAMEDEVDLTLYKGHSSRMFRKVPKDQVVADVVAGIERRARQATSPGRLGYLAGISGLLAPIIEYLGFGSNVEAAYNLWFQKHT